MKKGITHLIALGLCFAIVIPLISCNKKDESVKSMEFEAYCMPISSDDVAVEDGVFYTDTHILLTAVSTVTFKEIESLVKKLDGTIIGYISSTNDFQISFSEHKTFQELERLVKELNNNPIIEEASLEYLAELDNYSIPYTNDPWTDANNPSDLSGLAWDETQPKGNNWWAEAIGMPSVWNMDIEFQTVKVGLIDTMFDITNEDLDDNLFIKIWNNPENEDGNCYVSQLYQEALQNYNTAIKNRDQEYIKTTSNQLRNTFHGTHVAGIIAAEANNNFGIAGVSQNSQLYAYSMNTSESNDSSYSKWGSIFMLKVALANLLNEQVRVINISMGYDKGFTENSNWTSFLSVNGHALETFLLKYIQSGNEFLIIKAAGNESLDSKNDILGSITNEMVSKRIIIVGAAELNSDYYNIAEFSNIGERVDVYAPGVNVLSDFPTNITSVLDGTSMAAPIVTGLVALIWGINPDLTAEQVRQIIIASSSASIFDLDSHPSFIRDWINFFNDPIAIVNAKICVELAQNTIGESKTISEGYGTLNGILFASTIDSQFDNEFDVDSLLVYDEKGNFINDVTIQKILVDSSNTIHTYTVLLQPGKYTLEAIAGDYGSQKQELTILENETKVLDFDFTIKPLVSDAYSRECAYIGHNYNELSGEEESPQLVANFRIPQINLTSDAIKQINEDIYNSFYPDIQNAIHEIEEYGVPLTSVGMSYQWAVNEDILSLIVSNDTHPNMSGGTEYFVYNLSISMEKILSKDEICSAVNISQTEYYTRVKQLLSSEFFHNKEHYIDQNGYDDFFYAQLEKTTAEENILESMPYINEKGQLCVIVKIYSLAGADFYWCDLNAETAFNTSELLDNYWENFIQCRKVYRFFEDGTLIEYDIEPTAVINEDNLQFSHSLLYSFDNNRLIIEWEKGHELCSLEPVTKDFPIEWDIGLNQFTNIPDGSIFFYETEWKRNDVYPDNAMYLIKSETIQ